MAGWLGLAGAAADDPRALAEAVFKELGCDILCVTRGGDGAALITKEDGAFIEHPGFKVRLLRIIYMCPSYISSLTIKTLK